MKRLVIQKIRETVADEMQRSKYFRQIQVLSQLKGLYEIEGEEEEMLIYDVEKDPYYKRGKMDGELRGEQKGLLKGEQKGLLEGRREGLLEGIQLALDIKYGVKGLSLMDKISAVSDLNKLEQIKELIRHSTSVEELENLLN